jgi:hypothetical protein
MASSIDILWYHLGNNTAMLYGQMIYGLAIYLFLYLQGCGLGANGYDFVVPIGSNCTHDFVVPIAFL